MRTTSLWGVAAKWLKTTNHNHFEKFPVRISKNEAGSDAIVSSWAFVYFLLVMSSFSSLFRCVAFQSFSFCLAFTTGWTSSGSWFLGGVLFYFPMTTWNETFFLTLWHIARIQKTRGELLIYSLINTHQRILALLVEFPPADDVNNHFCSVASKVIQTGDFPPATNKLCWNSIAQKRLATKPMRFLLWLSGKCINTYVI